MKGNGKRGSWSVIQQFKDRSRLSPAPLLLLLHLYDIQRFENVIGDQQLR